MTRHTEHDAHADLLRSAEWQRMRAGFAVQGPYRRRRIGRWLIALAVVAACIAAAL